MPLGLDEAISSPLLTVGESPQGARFIVQPCTALSGHECLAYAQRPYACRRYECSLLIAFREGEVSLPEAQQVVERARHLQQAAPSDFEDYATFHFGVKKR